MHLLIYTLYVNQINMKEKIKLNKRKLAVHCVSLDTGDISCHQNTQSDPNLGKSLLDLQSVCVLTNDVCPNTSVEEGCRRKI